MEMRWEHEPCREKTGDTLDKIGMFAAMNHVTVKTLRFYEEQGLLMPELIHPETGYRYYTLSQMAVSSAPETLCSHTDALSTSAFGLA